MSPGPDERHSPQHAGDVTILLEASAAGSGQARDQLSALVYGELLGMARARMRAERAGHTLTATALVHETFVRLFAAAGIPVEPDSLTWRDRSAFFGAAATAMRRILVEHARAKARVKRGGRWRPGAMRVELDAVEASQRLEPEQFLSLTDAIARLRSVDHRAAEVTRLRFFAGLGISEVAAILEVTERTVKRDWQFARAWLHKHLSEDSAESEEADDAAGR